MKNLYSLLIMALVGTTSASAQWNTNATPRCILSALYQDAATGTTKNHGDYFACSPKAARTADKKTWLAWHTWDAKIVGNIRVPAVRTWLQLLDINGVPEFKEPILVNDHATPTYWSEYALCVAADGSAIVTVADSRVEEETSDPTDSPQAFTPAIYKIDQKGDFLWGLDGIDFRFTVNSPFTNAYVVGEDTYFLFNVQYDADVNNPDNGLYMMRINDDGTLAWEKPRQMATGITTKGQIVPSLDGEFLYFDDTPDGARVHRFDRDLNEVWGDPVIYDEYKFEGYGMNQYRLASDGNGGACVAFVRNMGDFSHNVRVQHINEDGSLAFGLTGLDAYNANEYDHNYPSIAVNPRTQEIMVQYASDNGPEGFVKHQKFTFDGDYLYNEKGFNVASKNGENSGGYMFGLTGVGSLPDGDWIAIYRDLAGWNKESIVIRRYDKDGNRVWTKTIGREIAPDDINYVVEPEAIYLFYREMQEGKNPGLNIFRIGADGTYNVTYPSGIEETTRGTEGSNRYYSLDGKQLSKVRKGINIVRDSDGTVKKFVVK